MFKFKINLDRHGPRPLPNICILPGPHYFSFPSTFKEELEKMGRKIRDFITVAKFCTLVCRMQFLENNFNFRYNAWYLKQ